MSKEDENRWFWIVICVAALIFWLTRGHQEKDDVIRGFRSIMGLPSLSTQDKYNEGYAKGYADGQKTGLEAVKLGKDGWSLSDPWAGSHNLRLGNVQIYGV